MTFISYCIYKIKAREVWALLQYYYKWIAAKCKRKTLGHTDLMRKHCQQILCKIIFKKKKERKKKYDQGTGG